MSVLTVPFQGKTTTQITIITLGALFILVGLIGFVVPSFLGMHLNLAHNLVHLVSGALALWIGEMRNSKAAVQFSFAFGAVYAFLGLAGFLFGREGLSTMGAHYMSDSHLLRVIPDVLEFGTMDHIVHLLLGALFIWGGLNLKSVNFKTTGRRS